MKIPGVGKFVNMYNQNRKILILAPGHYIYDVRPLRTVKIASQFGKCFYAVEEDRTDKLYKRETLSKIYDKLGDDVSVLILPHRTRIKIINRISRYMFVIKICLLVRRIKPHIIHIHESGRLGLLLSFCIRHLMPSSKIIFDYHDWIPLEIAQLCRNIKPIYNGTWPFFLRYYRYLSKSVDIFVCVSPGHAEWTQKKLGAVNTIVVQNVRDYCPPVQVNNGAVRHEIMFAGHVMRERKIEYAIDVIMELNIQSVKAKLLICGKVLEEDYVKDLILYAKNKGVDDCIVFSGDYSSSEALAKFIMRGTIGYWNLNYQEFDTGIEKITSGNKFFTYLSLGLPVLLEEGFDNMADILMENKAGYTFHSVKDFADKARKIWETDGLWESMRNNALEVSKKMNSTVYNSVIEKLYM